MNVDNLAGPYPPNIVPLAAQPEARPVAWIDDDTIARHTLSAKDCPPGSQVMLVSSLRRLRHQHSDKAEETIWQLTRALREAVESLTFMGEPVLSQPQPVAGKPADDAVA